MNGKKQNGSEAVGILICLVFFFFGLVVLIPAFPPFGILWCAVLGYIIGSLSKNRTARKKKNAWIATDREGQDHTGQGTKAKYLRHANAGGRSHSHTPVSFSYDECVKQKRLEQLDVLKGAGLLDAGEYAVRKQEILATSSPRR